MTTESLKAASPSSVSSVEPTRRDFLYVTTAAAAAVGALATLVPLIAQMSPDAATLAAGGPIDLDISKIQPGQQVAIAWRGRPILVTNRTPQLLQTLQYPRLLAQLADPQSGELQQPAYAVNWHRSLKPKYGVLVGICTAALSIFRRLGKSERQLAQRREFHHPTGERHPGHLWSR
jgi:ubiquinol-cytochrome c reductase iron-sulfur subunit